MTWQWFLDSLLSKHQQHDQETLAIRTSYLCNAHRVWSLRFNQNGPGPPLKKGTHEAFKIWFSGSNHSLVRYKAIIKRSQTLWVCTGNLYFILEVPKLEMKTLGFNFYIKMRSSRNDNSKVIALPPSLGSCLRCHEFYMYYLRTSKQPWKIETIIPNLQIKIPKLKEVKWFSKVVQLEHSRAKIRKLAFLTLQVHVLSRLIYCKEYTQGDG